MSKVTNAMILEAINNLNSKVDAIDKRVTAIENSKKPTSGKGKKPVSEKKPEKSFSEKKKEWAEAHFTEAERKAYGEAKKAERDKKHKAYEMACASFKEKVDYKVWKKKYNEILATL